MPPLSPFSHTSKGQMCSLGKGAVIPPARAICPSSRMKALLPKGCNRLLVVSKSALAEKPSAPVTMPPASAQTSPALLTDENPWEDEKWTKYKWTVYRGVAYDLTPYLDRHPGGRWLLNLAIGRDATALFESYHMRPEVAHASVSRLPVLEGFPVGAVPRSPYPNDSDLYNTIRNRVRKEIFKGEEMKGAHRSGSEWAALAVLGYAASAYILYSWDANVLTGTFLGLAGAWIGLTVQHCGNHGAMSTNATVNNLMGITDDLVGGSSLMWRYHHQVSHHIHCNDEALDEDVFSVFPLLRFDHRQPKYWFHQYQHIYMWFLYPFLQLGFQFSDLYSLAVNRCPGATLYGASKFERSTVIAGKLAHYTLLLGFPILLHGPMAAFTGAAAYVATQSIILASTFAVSHNVPEVKPLEDNSCRTSLYTDTLQRDWAEQQVLTSANWGGVVGNFFTGGLNLQIEHHLFPAVSFMHYPAISKIVEDECKKRGIQYAHYQELSEIIKRYFQFMKDVGVAEQVPMKSAYSQYVPKL